MRVNISQFASIAICEAKPYWSLVLREPPRFGAWVKLGTKHHSISQKEDALKDYKRLPFPELKKELAKKESVLELPSEKIRVRFAFAGMVFSGQLDKMLKFEEKVLVIDEKFVGESAGKMHERYHLQLGAYCLGLKSGATALARGSKSELLGEELFKDFELRYRIVERSRATRKVLFESEECLFEEEKLFPTLERFASILNDEVSWKEMKKPEKHVCARCEYAHVCTRAKTL